MELSIIETLEQSKAKGKALLEEAHSLLAAAGLTFTGTATDRKKLYYEVGLQCPESHWLFVGQTVSENVDKHVIEKAGTTMRLFYDREHLAVVEQFVTKDEAQSNTKWLTLRQAEQEWRQLTKKYNVDGKPTPKKTKVAAVTDEAQLLAAWFAKQDDATLSVLADVWTENGDPRGEFVHLSLADKPTEAFVKKHGGKLVGPARPYLRDWHFGANGIVDYAETEVGNVIKGIDQLTRINPKLCLTITALKTQKIAAELAKVSLAPLYYAGTTMGLGGGGCMMNDKILIAAAPAWRGVKRFSLSTRGVTGKNLSPAALQKFLDQLAPGVEYVLFDHWTRADEPNALPPVKAYTDVLRKHANTKTAQLQTDYKKLRGDLGLSA
ncbi:MAG: hypothetical protein QM831_32210 [Kofleriaceae bacterium]